MEITHGMKDFDIVENAGSIVLCMDREGNITYINNYALTFFGYTYEEVIGRHISETILPKKESTGRDLVRMISNICKKPDSFSINENENRRKNGSIVWVLWSNKPILSKEGKVIGVLSIGNDITKRKNIDEAIQRGYNRLIEKIRAQSTELRDKKKEILFEMVDRNLTLIELQESDEKYRNIVECAVEGIFQITEDGRFIMANNSLAQILGYNSPNELISHIKDYGSKLFVDKAERESFESLLKEQGIIKNFETRLYKKDGAIIWINTNVRTVYDFMGKILCFEGTVEDITDRKYKEKLLENSYEKLSNAMDGIINALSTTVELRDPYTAGHQRRVTELAVAIARRLNYTSDNIRFLSIASMLHDIGKLCAPAEILSKPGKLSKNEISLLRDHPDEGYKILKNIDFDYPVAEIIWQHHERMDGSGYPRGLKGDEILMDARIIGVADVFESMASHRPYRPSLGLDRALHELEKNKGSLYDIKVVDECYKVVREDGFEFTP